MDFKDAVISVLKDNFISFEGRASRSEYWWFYLFFVILVVGANVINPLLSNVALLALFLPMLGVSFRRMHDINKTAWWLLVGFIPVLGTLGLIYLFAQKGTEGENQYGKDPLSGQPALTEKRGA